MIEYILLFFFSWLGYWGFSMTFLFCLVSTVGNLFFSDESSDLERLEQVLNYSYHMAFGTLMLTTIQGLL